MAPSSTKLRIILLLVVLILIIIFASALYSLSVSTSNTDSASPNLAATVNAAANTEEGSRRLGIDLIIRDETLNASSNGLGNATACGFQGNSDIYGLGIRLGIYFQWAATLLSYLFLRESIDDVAAANWIFLIATVIATLVITAARSSLNTYSAEVVIMLYFVFGQITICLMPIIGNGPANYTILGAWGVVSCFLAVAIYESWFWINGRVSMTQTPCGTFMFMFKKVSITDVKNVSAATIVFIPVAIISGGLWFLASWKLIRRLKREYTEIEQSLQQQDSPRPKGIWNGMLRFVFAVTRSVGDESTTTRNRFETIFVYWHLFSKYVTNANNTRPIQRGR